MTAAIIDDVLSLIGVAILIPIILLESSGDAQEGINIIGILWIVAKVIVFFAITLFLGLVAFPERAPIACPNKPGLYQQINCKFSAIQAKFGVRQFLMLHKGEFTPLIMLFIAMLLGFIAYELGFHPAIGAYFAGLFLHADYFIHSKTIRKINEEGEVIELKQKDKTFNQTSHVIEHLAFTIFGPIFFVNLGGKLIFDTNVILAALPSVITLYITVLVFQVLSASLAARYTGKYHWHESVMIGLGMLGRAELAFIVINIAFVQNKIIDITQFYTLMFTAFLLNLTVPLALKWWKPYYLGFKRINLFDIELSRSKPAPVPENMTKYREMMLKEKEKYTNS